MSQEIKRTQDRSWCVQCQTPSDNDPEYGRCSNCGRRLIDYNYDYAVRQRLIKAGIGDIKNNRATADKAIK